MIHLRLAAAALIVFFGAAHRGEAKTPVIVYFEFEQEPSTAAIAEMKAELAAIMLPIGVEFEWRDLSRNTGNEVAAELVVVSFKGKCRAEGFSPRAPGAGGALGWTHTSDGHVLPFSDIQCDRIRRLVQPYTARAGPARRQKLLGRALGRVLAHELYHVFADTKRHGKGLAKPFYTPMELVRDGFRFADKEELALREGKIRGLAEKNLPRLAMTGQ